MVLSTPEEEEVLSCYSVDHMCPVLLVSFVYVCVPIHPAGEGVSRVNTCD